MISNDCQQVEDGLYLFIVCGVKRSWVSDVGWTQVVMGSESSILDQLDGDLGVGGTEHVESVSITGRGLFGGQRGRQLRQRVATLNLNIIIGYREELG